MSGRRARAVRRAEAEARAERRAAGISEPEPRVGGWSLGDDGRRRLAALGIALDVPRDRRRQTVLAASGVTYDQWKAAGRRIVARAERRRIERADRRRRRREAGAA